MFLQNISKFISNYRYEQASKETLNVVKAAFIDFFGVTYRGVNEESSRIAFNTISELFFGNMEFELESSVIGMPNFKTNLLNAGFLNGISAHVLELMMVIEAHKFIWVQLFSQLPWLLVKLMIWTANLFLEAVIAGYEVGIMLGQIVNPQHRNNGFHTTGTVGTFVAGAVASKLLNLDENQTLNALGLCGTQAAGLLESDHNGSMGKVLHVGKAVYNGLISAFLALNGFTGAGTIFDGDEGFLKTMVLSDSDFSLDVALKNMGKVRVRDIYFKKYPFCRHLHSSIDTVLKLKASIGEEYEHIGNVIIKTYDVAAKHDNYNPKNVEELKQSLPYAVAIMLVCGEIDLDDLNQLIEFGLLDSYSTVDKVNSIKNLASKIIIVSDSGLDELYPNKRPSNVIIKLDESFRGEFSKILHYCQKVILKIHIN